jgi:hypothetical protein
MLDSQLGVSCAQGWPTYAASFCSVVLLSTVIVACAESKLQRKYLMETRAGVAAAAAVAAVVAPCDSSSGRSSSKAAGALAQAGGSDSRQRGRWQAAGGRRAQAAGSGRPFGDHGPSSPAAPSPSAVAARFYSLLCSRTAWRGLLPWSCDDSGAGAGSIAGSSCSGSSLFIRTGTARKLRLSVKVRSSVCPRAPGNCHAWTHAGLQALHPVWRRSCDAVAQRQHHTCSPAGRHQR